MNFNFLHDYIFADSFENCKKERRDGQEQGVYRDRERPGGGQGQRRPAQGQGAQVAAGLRDGLHQGDQQEGQRHAAARREGAEPAAASS